MHFFMWLYFKINNINFKSSFKTVTNNSSMFEHDLFFTNSKPEKQFTVGDKLKVKNKDYYGYRYVVVTYVHNICHYSIKDVSYRWFE